MHGEIGTTALLASRYRARASRSRG